LKVVSLTHGSAELPETQAAGTPDPAAVEWLRGAMRTESTSKWHEAAAPGPSAGSTQTAWSDPGSAPTLGQRILTSMRGSAAGISNEWQQADALGADIQRRSTFDSGYIQDLIELQKKNASSYVKLDILSKTVGKAVYTVDSLSRN
jgi:hypothetical protein